MYSLTIEIISIGTPDLSLMGKGYGVKYYRQGVTPNHDFISSTT